MSGRQIVYDEEDQHEIEILSDVGTEILIDCFKFDFKQYVDYFGNQKITQEPTWSRDDVQNWDYMLMAAKDLYDYSEFMADFANQCGDNTAEYAFASAMALLDEVQQTLGEVFDFVNGDIDYTLYDLDSYKFWIDMYHMFQYVEDCIILDGIAGGTTT